VPTQAELPTGEEIWKGVRLFEKHLSREAMYKTATFLVEHRWGNPRETADALGVLLLTWNQAFYRYGQFSYEKLERFIKRNHPSLSAFRARDILSYPRADSRIVRKVFNQVLSSLSIKSGKKAGVSSPVAAAKALHLLAPDFFPLWDDKIARGYKLHYAKDPAEQYIRFIEITQRIAGDLPSGLNPSLKGRSAVKLIDGYNFARYTRKWL
jgi:hypothetical protein